MNRPPEKILHCPALQERLSAYEDGELSPKQRAHIEAHLATCPECRQELVKLQKLWLALDDPMPLYPQPGLEQKVLWRIADKGRFSASKWKEILGSLFPAPATVAVLGLLLGVVAGKTVLENPLSTVSVSTAQGQTVITEAMGVFAPVPRGSFAEGYLVMVTSAGNR